MEANELRIGNWVKCSEIVDVDKTREISCWDFGTYLSTDPEYYIPIPLTEEWLRSFGFVNGTTEKLKEVTHASIQYSAIEKMYHLYLGHHSLSVYLKYVHQLQNLYFALTGEELTIKQ